MANFLGNYDGHTIEVEWLFSDWLLVHGHEFRLLVDGDVQDTLKAKTVTSAGGILRGKVDGKLIRAKIRIGSGWLVKLRRCPIRVTLSVDGRAVALTTEE